MLVALQQTTSYPNLMPSPSINLPIDFTRIQSFLDSAQRASSINEVLRGCVYKRDDGAFCFIPEALLSELGYDDTPRVRNLLSAYEVEFEEHPVCGELWTISPEKFSQLASRLGVFGRTKVPEKPEIDDYQTRQASTEKLTPDQVQLLPQPLAKIQKFFNETPRTKNPDEMVSGFVLEYSAGALLGFLLESLTKFLETKDSVALRKQLYKYGMLARQTMVLGESREFWYIGVENFKRTLFKSVTPIDQDRDDTAIWRSMCHQIVRKRGLSYDDMVKGLAWSSNGVLHFRPRIFDRAQLPQDQVKRLLIKHGGEIQRELVRDQMVTICTMPESVLMDEVRRGGELGG